MVSYKFLPFAPGIRWMVSSYGIIKKSLPYSVLESKLKDSNVNVFSHASLLEAYFSLYICECINYNFPSTNIFWSGESLYHDLVHINGLAKIYDGKVGPEDLKRFPLPLFMDKQGNNYMNSLYNYRRRYTFNYTKVRKAYKGVAEQITANSLLPFNKDLMPKLRNLNNFDKFMRLNSIDKKFVLVSPDRTGYSKYVEDYLTWDTQDIRSFAAIMKGYNTQTVVLSNKTAYYGAAKVFKFDLELFLYLAEKCKYILAKDLDLLYVAACVGNASVVSLPMDKEFNIEKNLAYLNKDNGFYTMDNISVPDVSSFILNS